MQTTQPAFAKASGTVIKPMSDVVFRKLTKAVRAVPFFSFKNFTSSNFFSIKITLFCIYKFIGIFGFFLLIFRYLIIRRLL